MRLGLGLEAYVSEVPLFRRISISALERENWLLEPLSGGSEHRDNWICPDVHTYSPGPYNRGLSKLCVRVFGKRLLSFGVRPHLPWPADAQKAKPKKPPLIWLYLYKGRRTTSQELRRTSRTYELRASQMRIIFPFEHNASCYTVTGDRARLRDRVVRLACSSPAMGIKGLTGLISQHAPNAIKEHDIKTLFGRKVAIDASMSIYQFLIAVRQRDGEMLSNDAGETTSHLMGFFYRTIRIVENGIKPAYVFDGKPPDLKKGVLSKRFERREEAKEEGEEAKETGTVEEVDRLSRRTVKVTKEHNAECIRLLKLMGIPVVVAPSEAEAQCAELARGGKVYAAGSEDMDTLTFNAPILYRHLTFSEAKKQPISEIDLGAALKGLEMDMSQFIDLCILLGCDYLEPIKGVGPKSALKLIREYGGLAKIVAHLREKEAEKKAAAESADEADDEPAPTSDVEPAEDEIKKKTKKGRGKGSGGIKVPEDWPWEEAKKLFEKPDVVPADELELEWKNPDVDGLVQFLVQEKGFNEERVRKGAEKLQKFLNTKQQGRLDGFFSVKPKDKPAPVAKSNAKTRGTKRKDDGDAAKATGSGKKAKRK